MLILIFILWLCTLTLTNEVDIDDNTNCTFAQEGERDLSGEGAGTLEEVSPEAGEMTCSCRYRGSNEEPNDAVIKEYHCQWTENKTLFRPGPTMVHGVISADGRVLSSHPKGAFSVIKSTNVPGVYGVFFAANLQTNLVPAVVVTAWSCRRHLSSVTSDAASNWPITALLQHVSTRHFRYVILTSSLRPADGKCSVLIVWG